MHVLVFGEILWDVFPDHRTIGGASLNFAAHLQKLGCDATIVSAVGSDEMGEASLAELDALGLRREAVAVLPLATGQAVVTLDATGTPSYEIVEGVAYDHIPLPAPAVLKRPYDALYFGTLAQRLPVSRETLRTLTAHTGTKTVFCDINIRQHYYSDEVLEFCLRTATLLKISRDEIDVLAPWTDGDTDAQGIGRALKARFPQLQQLLLTLDADGASVWDAATDRLYYSKKPNVRVVSTVGGGDSFGACYLRHHLLGLPTELCLTRAVTLSNYVVTQLGGVPDYSEELKAALEI